MFRFQCIISLLAFGYFLFPLICPFYVRCYSLQYLLPPCARLLVRSCPVPICRSALNRMNHENFYFSPPLVRQWAVGFSLITNSIHTYFPARHTASSILYMRLSLASALLFPRFFSSSDLSHNYIQIITFQLSQLRLAFLLILQIDV